MDPQEEEQARQRRLEEEQLVNCTFTPNTKWKLDEERRQKATKEARRQLIEQEKSKSREPKLTVRC